MSVYKRSGSPYYQTEFRLRDGTRIRRSTGEKTRRRALAVEERIRREEEDRLAKMPPIGFYTLSQGFGQYWEEKSDSFAPSWAQAVARYANQIIEITGGDVLLADVSDAHVNHFVQSRKRQGTGVYAINRGLSVWRAMHNRAFKVWKQPVQQIDWSSFRGGEQKRVDALTIEQFAHLCQFLTERVALAAEWSVYTGCRWAETYNLTHEAVDLPQRRTLVVAKGGKRHVIWLSDQAIDVLRRAPVKGRYVFDKTNWRREWERGLRKAGLEGFVWHSLRHTHATWLRQAGVPLEVVQRSLGHEDIQTTMRYAHVNDTEVQEALQKLPTVSTHSTKVVNINALRNKTNMGA